MSAADRRDDADPTDPRLHPRPLTQWEVFELYLRDARLRPLLLAALGGLAMVFLVLFLGGSDIGAVAVASFGLAALAFRWVAGPPLVVLLIFYFSLFPFGLPPAPFDNPFEVRETHFRVADVLLAAAVLVYFRAFYRVLGVVHRSMPDESVFRPRGEHPARRPAAHVGAGEVVRVVAVAVALVVLGQLAWWLVNSFELAPAGEGFPLRWADPDSLARYGPVRRDPGEFSAGQSRFYVVVGVLFFGFLFLRLVFGYWRLRMLSAAEGAMMLTGTSWGESHRERVRVEKWRVWGRQKRKETDRREREVREQEEERRERPAADARGQGRS